MADAPVTDIPIRILSASVPVAGWRGRLLALLALVPLYATCAGCGGAGKAASAASKSSPAPSATSTATSATHTTATRAPRRIAPLPPPERLTAHFLNDGDNDHIGDPDGDNSSDNDNDANYDYQPNDNGRYHDSDDAGFVPAGQGPSAADRRTIVALVKRYYALADAGNSRGACQLITPRLRSVAMVQFGRYGPPFLRGAYSCQEVMRRMFRRQHRELTAPVTVTGIRITAPDHAFVLLGSPRMLASFLTPVRYRGRWMLDELLGSPVM